VEPIYFTISASPTSISVARGGSGTYSISTAVYDGFDSAISLSATGYPTGVTVGFSPSSIPKPGSGTSTMTVTVGEGVGLGNHTITINGAGADITHTTPVTLDVLQ